MIPKKDGTIRFLIDFKVLNTFLKRKKHALLLIVNIMVCVKKFAYATTLYLSMGYYTIILSIISRMYCVIVLSWVLHEYIALPMGLTISLDVFQ